MQQQAQQQAQQQPQQQAQQQEISKSMSKLNTDQVAIKDNSFSSVDRAETHQCQS